MNKWLGLILVLLMASCVDEDIIEKPTGGETVTAELNLWMPSLSNSSLTKAMTEADEAAVEELYVLVFDANDQFLYGNEAQAISDVSGDVNKKTAKVQLRTTQETVHVVALANMTQEGVSFALPSAGEDKTTYLKKLVYKISDAWPAVSKGTDGFRPFPMWGELKAPVTASMEMNLLRALARVNLTIADGQNFKMSAIQVYNSRQGGYCSPIGDVVATLGNVNTPSIPASGAEKLSTPLSYEMADSEDTIRSYKNEIYVPEATVADGFYLKVFGTIDGISKFYKVEFKKDGSQLVVLRNHTYNVNVTRVGTGESDCDVTIEEWSDVTMKNPNAQYSLTVDKSSIAFVAAMNASETVMVETDHAEGWRIDGTEGSWFTAAMVNGQLQITTNTRNVGSKKTGYVSVRAGQLVKKIYLTQQEEETSNCYLITDDCSQPKSYQLFVNLKGNGTTGVTADGHNLGTTADLATSTVAILWETTEGLVTINKDTPDNGVISYTVHDKAGKGGNALIGAFDKNKVLIWSWHIWIVPDGVNDEAWVTGYTFMDRYLGATSNRPGIASLGLLYQWGRKDPFIGAGALGSGSNVANAQKAYTKNYTVYGVEYSWKNSSSTSVEQSILNPTSLFAQGLCENETVHGKFLWGTAQGMTTTVQGAATNAGNKTIYDPCPIGYRVPPVDAWVFGSGTSSSFYVNWKNNVTYIPYTTKDNKWETDASAYGFWINYEQSGSKPSLNNDRTAPANGKTAAWLPLGGVYDGTIDNFANVGDYHSLKVNSLVWSNTPVTVNIGSYYYPNWVTRPAGLFLHGKEFANNGNGKHLHRFDEEGERLLAKTQYAGSVRCVKDIKKDYSNLSSITPNDVTLAGNAGATATVKLISINEDWEVVDPGAKWFYVTPQEGKADGGSGQTLTLIAPDDNYDDVPSATLVIRLKETGKELPVTVSRGKLDSKFVVNPSSLSFAALGGTQNVSIEATHGWTIQSLPEWISATPSSATSATAQTVVFTVSPNPSITGSRSYNVVVKQNSTAKTKTIQITQAASVFNVSKSSLSFVAAGGNQTATIEATNGWTITNHPDWLTVSPQSNADASKKTVTFTTGKNTSYDGRSGSVVVKSGSATKSISVSQSGRIRPSVSPNPLALSSLGNGRKKSVTINCESDVTWTAVVDSWAWISVDGKTSNEENNRKFEGKGSTSLNVIAGRLWIGSRTGSITITFSSGETVTLTVNQG